ncbi:unnamed protein product [Penicillium pancosmium]
MNGFGKGAAELTCNDYNVGWICALPKEQTAATTMLDNIHPDIPKPPNDSNSYTLGSIGKHNIVITCLPKGRIGNNAAATSAIQMVRTFPSIKVGLMVGIGGGIPPKVRLGDVVISAPVAEFPGVVQWDLGKTETVGNLRRTGALDKPPTALLTALTKLETQHEIFGSQIPNYLGALKEKYPRLAAKYTWSDSLKDPLSSPDEIQEKPEDIRVHYGLIASGDQVIKDAVARDRLNESLGGNVLCVEMEAAGLMDNFPCLVIRGICDYADAQKNEDWQEYAAAVAAACAKEVLHYVHPSDIDGEFKKIAQRTELNIKRIESNMDRVGRTEMLNWLTRIDYGTQHSDFIKLRQPQTGGWFLRSPEYQSWRDKEKQTLLCTGIPGAGKTIIAAIVIDDLTTEIQQEHSTGLAYLYCNFRRQHEQEVENLLASLVKQLSQNLPVLPDAVTSLHKRHERQKTRPSIDELSEALSSTVAIYSKVFIVVDALDECHIPDRRLSRFLSEIFSLQKKSAVNFLATSRPIPEIEIKFQGHASKNISASKKDICKYLDGYMSELPSFVLENSHLQELIKSEIVAAVGGMFLLARLHIDSLLGKRTPKAIRTALEKLPSGSDAYDHAYTEAMERIGGQLPDSRLLAEQILTWISCAKRQLSISELQHALAVEIGQHELDEDNIITIADILSVCAGLVTVDKESNIVRLVHYTAQEYFERKRQILFPNAEAQITRVCLTYLLFHSFDSGFCQTTVEFDSRLQSYKLYDYSASYWGHHAREALKREFDPLVTEFLRSKSKVEAASQAQLRTVAYLGSRLINTQRTGLHLAAFFELEEAATNLFQHYVDVNAGDYQRKTPLALAAEKGHASVVRLLIGREANPELADFQGRTPLLLAIENGHDIIVKQLLEEGVEGEGKNSRWNSERIPLALAALHNLDTATKLLLDKKVDVDGKGAFQTPLAKASEHGHEKIVKMLLDNGANVDGSKLDESTLSTPLSLAARNGHKGVVKMLLDRGAQVEGKEMCDGKYTKTPLEWAAKNGHEKVVMLLLDNDAGLEPKSQGGRTPLLRATVNGHELIVRELLKRGADVNTMNNSGKTPLIWAARYGNETVTRLLLDSGADPNLKDSDGHTPLLWAARNGYEAVVKLLLDRGADIKPSELDGGQTPLSWAAKNGHKAVVRQLLVKKASMKLRTVA